MAAEHTDWEQLLDVLQGKMRIGYERRVQVLTAAGVPITSAQELVAAQVAAPWSVLV